MTTESELKETLARWFLMRLRQSKLIVLASLIVAVLVVAWLLDAPGLWCGFFAERYLRQQHPHQALLWTARGSTYSTAPDEMALLEARARLQQNSPLAAARAIEQAEALGAQSSIINAYKLMVETQQGDLQAVDQLLNFPDALPQESYEAILRCAEINEQFERAHLIMEELAKSADKINLVNYHRGRISELQEDYDKAIEHYRASYLGSKSSRSAFRAAACLSKVRDFEHAAEWYRKINELPYVKAAKIELANSLWELGKYDEAAETIADCTRLLPRELQPIYLELDEYVDVDRAALVAARIEDGQQHASTTIDLLQRVLRYNDRDFEARALLLKNLTLEGRTAEANEVAALQRRMIAARERIRDLKIELDTDNASQQPNYLEKRCELAELYWYVESTAEGLMAIDELLEHAPNYPKALALRERIRIDEANRWREQATDH